MGLLTVLLRRLSAFIDRAAAALERWSGAVPRDGTMALLAEQFPGAPRHWLEYIAGRTPHFAPGRRAEQVPPREFEVPHGSAQEPLLRLQAREPRAHAEPLAPQHPQERSRASAPVGTREEVLRARPHLRLLKPRPAAKAADRPLEIGDGAASVGREQAEPPKSAPNAAPRRAHLHFAAARDETPMSELRYSPRTSAKPVPQYDSRAASPSSQSPATSFERHEAQPRPAGTVVAFKSKGVPPPIGRDEETIFANLRSSKSVEPLVLAGQRPVARTAAPSWTQREARNIAFQSSAQDNARSPWPALPPVHETIADAFVSPPRLELLAREQEEGLWNA